MRSRVFFPRAHVVAATVKDVADAASRPGLVGGRTYTECEIQTALVAAHRLIVIAPPPMDESLEIDRRHQPERVAHRFRDANSEVDVGFGGVAPPQHEHHASALHDRTPQQNGVVRRFRAPNVSGEEGEDRIVLRSREQRLDGGAHRVGGRARRSLISLRDGSLRAQGWE